MSNFLASVETFLAKHGVSPTQLGVAALRDPAFLPTLKKGRSPRLSTAEKVQIWMDDYARRVAANPDEARTWLREQISRARTRRPLDRAA